MMNNQVSFTTDSHTNNELSTLSRVAYRVITEVHVEITKKNKKTWRQSRHRPVTSVLKSTCAILKGSKGVFLQAVELVIN